jgi:hypothetical protein
MTDLTPTQPLEVIRHWQDAANIPDLDADATREYLTAFGQADKFLQAAEINMRMALGNLLLLIQDRGLYEGLGYNTWTEFRKTGLAHFGISEGTAGRAMYLASSKALQKITPEERGEISVSNGVFLARHEQINGHIKPDLIEKAKTMPTAKLAVAAGANIPICIRVWVFDREAAEHIQRINEFLKKLSASAAGRLADLVESQDVKKLAGDGADDNADLFVSVLEIAIENEIDEANARMRTLAE